MKQRNILLLLGLLGSISMFSQNRVAELQAAGIRAMYASQDEEAIRLFTAVLQEKPDFQMAFYNRGLVYYRTRAWDSGIRDFAKVISLDSSFTEAYYYLGESYLGKSESNKAIEAFSIVLKSAPTHAKALQGIGTAFYYQRKYPQAIEALKAFLENQSADVAAWYKLGLCHFYQGEFELAIRSFSQALQINPEYHLALEMRANGYKMNSDLDKACADWKHAMELGNQSSAKDYETYCH